MFKNSGSDQIIACFKVDFESTDETNVDLSDSEPEQICYRKDHLDYKMCASFRDTKILLVAEDTTIHNRIIFFSLSREEEEPDKLVLVNLNSKVQRSANHTGKVKDLIVVFHPSLDFTYSYMACIALRDDFSISVYSDFTHMQDWQLQKQNPEEEILEVVIHTDLTSFFLF